VRTDDEKRAYAKGYNAAQRHAWPEHRPPVPPEPVLAALVKALSGLRDVADDLCATLDEEDPVAARLAPLVDVADEAMAGLTAWLTARPAE
jgi:hypothetical protein